MVEGANKELESGQETSQVSDESLNTSAEMENTEEKETEGQSIPYDRFKQVNTQKNEYKTKAEELENKMKSYSWVEDFNKVIAEDPSKEQKIIDILLGKDSAKKEETEEEPDEITLLKKKIDELENGLNTDKKSQQDRIFASYEDDFQSQVKGIEKDSLLNVMLKMATQTVLDTKYKGWRERHIPNVMSNAYKDVRVEFDKYLNNEKKDYIDNKTKSDSPDIGKGQLGDTADKVPFGDDQKMQEFVSKFMTGG